MSHMGRATITLKKEPCMPDKQEPQAPRDGQVAEHGADMRLSPSPG